MVREAAEERWEHKKFFLLAGDAGGGGISLAREEQNKIFNTVREDALPLAPPGKPTVGCQIRSDQVSRSVAFDSSRPHESQHARPPCPSPTPGVH